MKDLLLLHGALGCKYDFDDMPDLLSQQFNVHTMDFNGHGSKDLNPDTFTIHGFSEEVLIYMDTNGIGSACIFGYSMGGYVAIDLSIRHTARVDGIFTLATMFDWNLDTAAAEAGKLNPEVLKEKVPEYVGNLQNIHGEKWEDLVKNTARLMRDLGENHLTDKDLNKVSCPVTISVGDRDRMVSAESSKSAAEKIPDSRFLIFENTPHPFQKVDKSILAESVSKFFKF